MKRNISSVSEPKRLHKKFKSDSKDKVLQQVLINSPPSLFYINHDLLQKKHLLDHFSTEIAIGGDITNQESTGRCWMFALLEPIRAATIRKYDLATTFNFSTSWLLFWDKYEKIRTTLMLTRDYRHKKLTSQKMATIIGYGCSDGGNMDYLFALIRKYGLIPETEFGETYHSRGTIYLRRELRTLLLNYMYRIRESKQTSFETDKIIDEALADVYRLLCYFLNTPPSTVNFRYTKNPPKEEKTADSLKKLADKREFGVFDMVTPEKFYKTYVPYDIESQIFIINNPIKAYDQKHKGLSYIKNVYEAPPRVFINMSMNNIKEYMRASINAGIPVVFSCDICAGNYYSGNRGILHTDMYDPGLIMPSLQDKFTKHERLAYGASYPNHMCTCVGYDELNKTWKIANSWGSKAGNSGYWIAYDCWIDEYLYEIILDRQFLSVNHQEIIDGIVHHTYRLNDVFH